MREYAVRHRWAVPTVLGVAMIACLLLAVAVSLRGTTAQASGDENVHPETGNHYHAADLVEDGRFTGPTGQWPPRPKGAPALMLVPEAFASGDEGTPVQAQVALADTSVAAAIGDRWSLIGTEAGVTDGKGQEDAARSIVQFFSLSNNQTVNVELSGGVVASVATVEPGVFQPEISTAENTRAIAIARQYWLDLGHDDINALQGFGIRAFTADDEFYDVRMVYVSFHVDAEHLPVYIGNVDLTNGTVENQRVDS